MSDYRPIVEYMTELMVPGKPAWNTDVIPCPTDDPMAMPVEHLEARICELAEVNELITDDGADAGAVAAIRDAGVRVTIGFLESLSR